MEELLNEEVVNVAEEVVEDVVTEVLPNKGFLKLGGAALVVGAVVGGGVVLYKKCIKPFVKSKKGNKVYVMNNDENANETDEDSKENSEA